MGFINLTPHPVTIVGGPTFPSSGIARARTSTVLVDVIADIAIVEETLGAPEWPEGFSPKAGDKLIVSRVFADSVKRNGTPLPTGCRLYCPGNLARDDAGNIIGCHNLIRLV